MVQLVVIVMERDVLFARNEKSQQFEKEVKI